MKNYRRCLSLVVSVCAVHSVIAKDSFELSDPQNIVAEAQTFIGFPSFTVAIKKGDLVDVVVADVVNGKPVHATEQNRVKDLSATGAQFESLRSADATPRWHDLGSVSLAEYNAAKGSLLSLAIAANRAAASLPEFRIFGAIRSAFDQSGDTHTTWAPYYISYDAYPLNGVNIDAMDVSIHVTRQTATQEMGYDMFLTYGKNLPFLAQMLKVQALGDTQFELRSFTRP